MCPIFLLQNSLHPSGHTVQCAHSSADVHFYLWLTVRLFSCRWYYYYKTKTIYSNVPFRSLEERVNGQAAQSLTAQAEVTSQVATLAESTTSFDEKIAAFMRNIRGDFRCTREELVGVMEERVQLALEVSRAWWREVVEKQHGENSNIWEQISDLARFGHLIILSIVIPSFFGYILLLRNYSFYKSQNWKTLASLLKYAF